MLAGAKQLSLIGRCSKLQQQSRRRGSPRRLTVRPARAQSDAEDREMENQFEEELRRRGLGASASSAGSGLGSGAATPRSPFEQQQQRSAPRPPPAFTGAVDDSVPPQLRRSMALNSEGLEGFLPRATELLKLGGTFFLGFAPFILAVTLGFAAVYAVFGDAFVHGGSPAAGPPPYIDPDLLLAEPTADPMVPLDLR